MYMYRDMYRAACRARNLVCCIKFIIDMVREALISAIDITINYVISICTVNIIELKEGGEK